MENLKFILTMLGIIVILGLLGFWAFGTLESGEGHLSKERITELEKENQTLKEEIENLEDELALYKPIEEEVEETGEEVAQEEVTEAMPEYQDLLNRLEGLISDKIYMSQGSKGTRVGAVQEFLNIYHNTSKTVDNDYGKTTKADITAFQKAEGLTADGEAGPNTYQKMIDWLNSQ